MSEPTAPTAPTAHGASNASNGANAERSARNSRDSLELDDHLAATPTTSHTGGLGGVGDVTRHTLAILASAQDHADNLRRQVEEETARTRADNESLRLESERLGHEVSASHDEANRVQQQAATRLRAAHEDADQLHRDAAEQAAVITDAAVRTSEEAISAAYAEAEQLVATAQAQAAQLVTVARTEHDSMLARTAAQQSEQTAEHEHRVQLFEVEERRRRSETGDHLVGLVREAEQQAAQLRSAAQLDATRWRDEATAVLGAGRADARQLADEARTSTETTITGAQQQADGIIAAADQHMAWTQTTMKDMLDGAHEEVARLKAQSHHELLEHVREHRQRTQSLVALSTHRAEQALAAAAAESTRLRAQSAAILASAEEDTRRTADHSAQVAARVIADAQSAAADHVERAERRLAEAEQGARLIRERTGADVEKLQREAHENRRSARTELVQTIADARAEADTLRADARRILAEARGEVEVLTRYRNDITSQLGNLSGVIEALAVSERPQDLLAPLAADDEVALTDGPTDTDGPTNGASADAPDAEAGSAIGPSVDPHHARQIDVVSLIKAPVAPRPTADTLDTTDTLDTADTLETTETVAHIGITNGPVPELVPVDASIPAEVDPILVIEVGEATDVAAVPDPVESEGAATTASPDHTEPDHPEPAPEEDEGDTTVMSQVVAPEASGWAASGGSGADTMVIPAIPEPANAPWARSDPATPATETAAAAVANDTTDPEESAGPDHAIEPQFFWGSCESAREGLSTRP